MELALILPVVAALLVAIFVLSRPGFGQKPIDKNYVRNQWSEIMEMAKLSEKSAHHAVIEADKLLDWVLKARNFKGETMGERLKAARQILKDNNGVWSAHKLRNQLVHENNLKITVSQTKRALASFYKALKDLGAV